MKSRRTALTGMLIGDIVCALILSLIGFYTHYGRIEGWRWLTTFVPVLVGWFAIAPWLGVYSAVYDRRPTQSWRAGLSAFLAAPLAGWIRGAWLNTPILPLFILVLGLTDAFGFLIWRFLWSLFLQRYKRDG
jgi:hypothetical protein